MTGGNPVGLVEFLLARYQDVEVAVRDALPGQTMAAYVLQDIAAKRRIIELHRAEQLGFGPDVIGCRTCDAVLPETWGPDLLQPGQQLYPCETLRLLAAPFSSHPDWQPEWSAE